MIVFFVALFLVGLCLSAFFSGSETGFYRANRLRFVLNDLEGDRFSKFLIKLFNAPSWFVATTLVGNNIANYLVSLSLVLIAGYLNPTAEMLMPLMFTPFLFVYGELLPKNLFYQKPNFLLRACAPLILFFSVVFAPVTVVLWGISKLIEKVLGQSPVKVKSSLAKKELNQIFFEGTEAGVLLSFQRQLAESFLLVASRPVREFCTPLSKIEFLRESSTIEEILDHAESHGQAFVPLVKDKTHELVGYVRTSDLVLEKVKSKPVRRWLKIPEIKSTELFGEALIQMQTNDEYLMKVVSPQGQVIGLVSLEQLTNQLLEGQLVGLRR